MMNWEAIGAVGEVLGALAVVVTLVFLTAQLRQNTRATRAQTVQDLSKSLTEYLLVQAHSGELGQVWEKVEQEGYAALTVKEEFHFRGFTGAILYSYKNAYVQMQLVTIGEEEWEEYRILLNTLFDQWSSIKDVWETYKRFYPQDFVHAVEDDPKIGFGT